MGSTMFMTSTVEGPDPATKTALLSLLEFRDFPMGLLVPRLHPQSRVAKVDFNVTTKL